MSFTPILNPGLLINQLPGCIFAKDIEGKFRYVNEALCNLTQKTPPDFLGKTDFEIFPELGEKYKNDDALVLREKTNLSALEPFYLPDKKVILIHVSKSPLIDDKGELLGIIGSFVEATEPLALDPKLSMFYEILLKEHDEIEFTTDQAGHITQANNEFRKLLDLTKCDSGALSLYDICPVEHKDRIYYFLTFSGARRRHMLCLRFDILAAHMHRRSLLLSTQASNKNGVTTFRFFGKDITSVLAASDSSDVAARAQLLNHFSQTVAHDVRRELDLSLNTAWALRRRAISREVQNDPNLLYSKLKHHLYRSLSILDQIQRISRGGGIANESFDLKDLINQLANPERGQSVERHLKAVFPNYEIPQIVADKALMRRALENVIQNAIEATPKWGEIKVKLSMLAPESLDTELRAQFRNGLPRATILMEVIDNGVGITAKELQEVCNYGFTTKGRPHEERGIGLWFCRIVMPIFGGSFVLLGRKDQRGARACFMFNLN